MSSFASNHMVRRKPDKISKIPKEDLENEEAKQNATEEAWLREERDWEQ